MRFLWFWTFWHWSKESFRDGALLRDPLHGIGGHWDEWFRHEASEPERHAIEAVGRSPEMQRQFITWLIRHWVREVGLGGNRLASRFVLGQLAQLPPFKQWAGFEKFRAGYGVGGLPAIVLTEKSAGEAADIRPIEAIMLPLDAGDAQAAVVPEGFQSDAAELSTPRNAALSLLGGKALRSFLVRWVASGRRPYPTWLKMVLAFGWLTSGALVAYLLLGPDPGDGLEPLSAALVALWSLLLGAGTVAVAVQIVVACRQGRLWHARLAQSQLRLRMEGGLTLKGGSAGLAFCLNTILAVYRAHPRGAQRSWLWRLFLRRLHADAPIWAATGVVTDDGRIQPVVLEPKLRSSLRHPVIQHILTPRQPDARQRNIDRLATRLPTSAPTTSGVAAAPGARLGLAAEPRRLSGHACRSIAAAMMILGGFWSPWQIALNAFAAAVTIVMVLALPDLRNILQPPPAPVVTAPGSPSPYDLWVSLNTDHPEAFQVVMESGFWANRRALVIRHSGPEGPPRAEIRLRRVGRQTTRHEEDGTIWIERRRRFLVREFSPGERVGHYSFSYVTRLGQ